MRRHCISVRTPTQVHTLHVAGDSAAASLADVLRQHGLPLNTRCGQRGLCDGCTVELISGQVGHIRTHERLSSIDTHIPFRACEHRALSDVIDVQIPQRAMLAYSPEVLDDFAIRIPHARDPLVAFGRWGIAVDVGTTTVALMLVDLQSCQITARASAFNAQMHLGDDVLTRITLCMNDPQMLRRMQSGIVQQTIVPLLDEVLSAAGSARVEDIGAIVVAGNTTMLHLLAGEDPSDIGVAPFVPRFTHHRVIHAGVLHPAWRKSIPQVPVHLLPGASGYIGADIVAGVVATGMAYEPQTSMLVDLGTNGEIVLRHEGHTLACATAAGPAFEGAGLTCGMRAGDGAITSITLGTAAQKNQIRWIGQERSAKPAGLCGSAYIDFLAEARRIGLISDTGRFTRAPQSAYQVAAANGNRPIVISECDIASLLSAKAAISAGIELLLAHLELRPADVRHLYLAGGFGTRLNAANAIAIGLLPPGFSAAQVVPVGNTSLAGAFLALTDQSILADMTAAANAIEVLELNTIAEFQDAYIDALRMP